MRFLRSLLLGACIIHNAYATWVIYFSGPNEPKYSRYTYFYSVTAAVAFEHATPNWERLPGMQDGPAGQVISFLGRCGHRPCVGRAACTCPRPRSTSAPASRRRAWRRQ